MTKKEVIYKRKSIRKFEQAPLDAAALEGVSALFSGLLPLYPEIKYTIEISNKTKGMFNIKAPHYLIFRSEEKEGHLENIGFIGQQLDLLLPTLGIGACWLGGSKPDKNEAKEDAAALPYVICIAFGKPAEPLFRNSTEFKRKSLAEMSQGTDDRLEAARLAPSGVNAQNWHFIADADKIHCYRKKPNPIAGLLLNKMSHIDIGIAICHLAETSENFTFTKDAAPPTKKGHEYTGTVS